MALTDNVIAAYHLEENAASTAVDDAASTNDLTSSTNTSNLTITGQFNNGFDFDGSTENMGKATFSEISVSNNWSVSFWFKADSTGASQVFFAQALGTNDRIAIGFSSTANNIGVRSYGGVGSDTSEKTGFSDTASWHHFVLIHNSDNTISWYIDGSAQSNDGAGAVSTDTPTAFKVASDNAGNQFYNGKVDEIVIWSRAITSGEVAELWNSGTGLEYPFTANITVTPSALTLTLALQNPEDFVASLVSNLGLTLSVLSPSITRVSPRHVTEGTGTIGTAIVRKGYYDAEDLISRQKPVEDYKKSVPNVHKRGSDWAP